MDAFRRWRRSRRTGKPISPSEIFNRVRRRQNFGSHSTVYVPHLSLDEIIKVYINTLETIAEKQKSLEMIFTRSLNGNLDATPLTDFDFNDDRAAYRMFGFIDSGQLEINKIYEVAMVEEFNLRQGIIEAEKLFDHLVYVNRDAKQESVLEKLDERSQQVKIAKLEDETKDVVINGMKAECERHDVKKTLLTKIKELIGIEAETKEFKNKHFKTSLYSVEKEAIIRKTEKDPLEATDIHRKGQEALDNTKALSNGSFSKPNSPISPTSKTDNHETE